MTEPREGALSRRKFIAVAGGSVAAAPLLAACGSDSASGSDETGEFGDGDAGILNFALTVEHVQAAFYAEVAASNLFGAANLKALEKFGEEEDEHIASLTKEVEKLGGEPVEKPETKFSLKSEKAALQVASELENVGAAAYLGQLPKIESAPALKTVLSIHSVEGRHAAAVDELLGEGPTPDGAFAEPATVETVLAAIDPFMA
jgi:rubrerythrin